MLALTLIPILDGLVVFKYAGWIFKPAIKPDEQGQVAKQ